MIQDVFGSPVDVNWPQDFSFIRNYGTPYHVDTLPDRGLFCFHIDSPRYGKLLLRFAGSALADGLSPDLAVAQLRDAVSMYQALYPHPALIKLQGHGQAAGGYAAIFRRPEGVLLHQAGVQQQLQRQPLLSSLRMIDSAFDFHLYAMGMGYVPGGFCDGSLCIDFASRRLTICDIDRYRRIPAVNDVGRMPGSAQFMAPEEFLQGSPLDELTAQYAMGALAFFFFGAYSSRERAAWMAGEALYRVAARACDPQREKRFASLAEFVSSWRQAAGETV